MTASARKRFSPILAQVPTLLTFVVLGGVLWWGYAWDWKIPRLPELLGREEPKKAEESDKKEDKQDEKTDNLPLVTLASVEALTKAGIRTKAVQRQIVEDFVTGQGQIDYDQNHYAHLSTRASGTASSVHKDYGDQVKKGDILALIASPELASIKFNLRQSLLLVETRQRLFDRLKMTRGATAGQERDNAEAALREANIRLSNEQQSLQNLGLSIHLEELRNLSDAQIAGRLRTLGIPETLLQRLDAAALSSNLLPMYAPFDGVVVTRDIVNGEVVSPAKPQFVLADLRQLWIMLHVRMEDAHRLARDQEVFFRLDGADREAPPAKITFISPEVDKETRTVVARAEVSNPKGELRPNTFGTARILVGKPVHLTVPNEALQFDGKSQIVFVRGQSPLKFQPKKVTVGPQNDKSIVILSGIAEGQEVAVAGTHVLLSVMQKERIEGDD